MEIKPKQIKRAKENLQVIWSDQHVDSVPYAWLRKSCSCAVCREMKTPLNESQPFFPRATTLAALDLVGNYALGLQWADGHRSIFSFDRLRTHLEDALREKTQVGDAVR